MTCAKCGAPLADGALSCGACHHLVHAALLTELAAQARAEEGAGDLSAALTTWRRALDLLPPGTRQQEHVTATIAALSERLDRGEVAPAPASDGKATGIGAFLLTATALLWKGKFLLVLVLTKAKVLLLGLTKLPTLLSMALTVGLYGSLFGWPFAVGFVLAIYLHEMGHVFALRRYGIPATAPMLVPGLGAFVRLKQYPSSAREDAVVGLGGPIWGFVAALGCAVVWLATGSALAGALARVGAWVNLFNLIPVWQLDGGRGWRALSRKQRWIAVGAAAVGWGLAEDILPLIIGVVGAVRAASAEAPEEGDSEILATYAGLVLAFCTLVGVIPGP